MASQAATLFNRVLDKPTLSPNAKDDIKRLRRYILLEGIPSEEDPSIRPRVWKLFLNVNHLNVDTYLNYVSRGPREEFKEKIRNDTFRTLATDKSFKERVQEDMLVRLLDAFVWRSNDLQDKRKLGFTYVQGMNVIAAPFLYTMPSEIEAFYCFASFIETSCPLYVQPTLEGVHRGLRLLDRCFEIVDNELYKFLRSKNLTAEIYGFPSVMTLCACTPPLDQVLHLWDFLLAFGVHLNVLCVIAQLILMRDTLLSSPSPMKILRHFPNIVAQEVIAVTVALVRDIPAELYDELVKHPYQAYIS